MTKIDIFSGFLGAGKTTLIKKLIAEAYAGEQLVLIENEFGEIGIDGGFLQDAGVNITEMNSGCICCSLVGDFTAALGQVLEQYHPDRILIEPSGVGKLSDVIQAVQKVPGDVVLNGFTTVVDAKKAKVYMKNFGEFFNNQVEHASAIILSHTGGMDQTRLEAAVALLREHNSEAPIVTTPWDQLTGAQLLEAMEQQDTLKAELVRLAAEAAEHDEHEHAHHHHEHDGHEHHEHDEHEHHAHDHEHDCDCGCHEHDHEHHHHDHDHDGHEHHHEHEHGPDCSCGCHDHDHHDHHHADEIFTSWGVETPKTFTMEQITAALKALEDETTYGSILRAKGIVPAADGSWIHFDYVPGEPDVRTGSASITGRLCVIGAELNESAVAALFGVA